MAWNRRGGSRLGALGLSLLGLGVLGSGCAPANETNSAMDMDSPDRSSGGCEVVSESQLATDGRVSWAFDVAVGLDGQPLVVWSDEGQLHAEVRDADGGWRVVTGALAQGDVRNDIDLEGAGVADPVLLVRNDHYRATTAWRWTGDAWSPLHHSSAEIGANQSRAPLAVDVEGRARFSIVDDPLGSRELSLYEASIDDAGSVRVGAIDIDGRDPLLRADANGQLHMMYAGRDTRMRGLHYRGPDGLESEVLAEHDGWPDMAVSEDGIFAAAVVDDDWVVAASVDGQDWTSYPVGEPVASPCPQYDPYDGSQNGREGEVCDSREVSYSRATLVDGPAALVVVEEIVEQGRLIYRCNTGHGGSCGWARAEGFEETHRLLIGRLGLNGVELRPLPVPLRPELHHTWAFRVDQDQNGRVHLVLNQVHQVGDGTPDRITDLHHVELHCAGDGN